MSSYISDTEQLHSNNSPPEEMEGKGIHSQDTEQNILGDSPIPVDVSDLHSQSLSESEHGITRDIHPLVMESAMGQASAFLYDVLMVSMSLWREPLRLTKLLLLALPIVTLLFSASLCGIPWVHDLSVCRDPTLDATFPQWADFPRLIDAQITTFEQLLDTSVGSSALSLDIKKAEMAVLDLAVLVRSSTLTSKDVLGEELIAFAHDARSSGRGLQRLSSKVAATVDLILAVNEYAMATISKAQTSFPSFGSEVVAYVFPESTVEKVVLRTFAEAMQTLSTVVERLILLAEVELANLERLEEHLSVLYDIVIRENFTISSTKAELLGAIWTWLGGNRSILKGYDEHLTLLSGVADYRKRALIQVISSLQALRALSNDMEGLREQMSKPTLSGQTIPVEIHTKSIELGVRRLKSSRALAKEKGDAARQSFLEDETTKKIFTSLDGYKS
ncbi:hypothetical protein F5877DRAFT_81916 [Lentinula edodes]|nr:hypothetical protein F5877DRAFT_81916 [Lentinula edodes]